MNVNAPPPAARARPRPPAVDAVLAAGEAEPLLHAYGREALLHAVRAVLGAIREAREDVSAPAVVLGRAAHRLEAENRPSLRPVLNLTGTVLHTNLGRAPLPPEAVEAVARVMAGPCNLEYDLDRGARGERDDHVEALIRRLTGAEAALVVNNNAAAVLLVLNALSQGRETIVSRGELVEIGGSFRVPDVMARANATLREVGTTNRTHLRDYAEAIGSGTGLVMKVHQSNYAIHGFTAEVHERELGALCTERGVPLAVDLGSGNLIDFSAYGLPPEPTVRAAVAQADLVTFSGDKLLGAVQCGIVAGRRALVDGIRRNPLKRALRVDKMTYAALEAVLRLYLHPERLHERLPALRLLVRPQAEIHAQALRLEPEVEARLGSRARVAVEPCRSQIGSGALPVESLPSACLTLRPPEAERKAGAWLARLAGALRALPVPVIGRVAEGALRLDLRTLEDEGAFLAQITALAADPAFA